VAPDTLIPPKKVCIGVNELETPVVTPVTAPVNPLKEVTLPLIPINSFLKSEKLIDF